MSEDLVANGEVCATCEREFMDAHGRPVLCYICFGKAKDGEAYSSQHRELPKGWFELEPR